jgi:hypothetical protein
MLRCGPDDAPTLNFDTPVALTRYDLHRLREKRQLRQLTSQLGSACSLAIGAGSRPNGWAA